MLFADCRGFSALVESYPAEEVVRVLNRFFQAATDVLLAHDACIDKLMGDQLMAVFGAPIVRPDHADQAVEAAVEIQTAMTELFPRGGEPRLRIGIAINSGVALVGNLGSREFKDFTAIGDVVNLGAHLQEQAGPGEVLVTEATTGMLAKQPDHAAGRVVAVKGRAEPVRVTALVFPEGT